MGSSDKEMGNTNDIIQKENKNGCNSEMNLLEIALAEGNGQSEIDDAKEEEKKVDILSKAIIALRARIYNFYIKNAIYWKYTFYLVLNIMTIGYLIAVAKIYKEKGHSVDYWKGLGLLIVLYSLLYGGLLYFFLLKPYCGSTISKILLKPARKIGNLIWNLRFFKLILCLVPVILISTYLFFEYQNNNKKKLVSFTGILVFLIFGYVFSASPGHVKWRTVISGIVFQFLFGLTALKWEIGRQILQQFGNHVTTFLNFSQNGTTFVYGALVSGDFVAKNGAIFAFSALPVIFFFSFVVSILSYYNALQWFILKLAWAVQTCMGTTVCESVSAVANIFIGAIKDLTKSELHAIMCGGWATVAGTVLAAYISFGVNPSHLIVASVMSAPASLSFSKLFYPEREKSKTTFKNITLVREEGYNVLDAACKGAATAIDVVANIVATLVAFLAFMAFLDSVILWLGILIDFPDLSFQYILAKIFIPVTFLMGIDDESIEDVALLVGTKTFVNEFRAYELMKTMKHKFSERTEAIATYALCGFSNFSSIGIFIGVIRSLQPSQTASVAEVSARAFISANIVCCLTACVAGVVKGKLSALKISHIYLYIFFEILTLMFQVLYWILNC